MFARLAVVFATALLGLVVGLGVADDITYARLPSGLDQHFDRFFETVALITFGRIPIGVVAAAQVGCDRQDTGRRWGSSLAAGLIVGFA